MTLKTNTKDLVQFTKSNSLAALVILSIGGFLLLVIAYVGVVNVGNNLVSELLSLLPGILLLMGGWLIFLSNTNNQPPNIELRRSSGSIHYFDSDGLELVRLPLNLIKTIDLKEERVRASVGNSTEINPVIYYLMATFKSGAVWTLAKLSNPTTAKEVVVKIQALISNAQVRDIHAILPKRIQKKKHAEEITLEWSNPLSLWLSCFVSIGNALLIFAVAWIFFFDKNFPTPLVVVSTMLLLLLFGIFSMIGPALIREGRTKHLISINSFCLTYKEKARFGRKEFNKNHINFKELESIQYSYTSEIATNNKLRIMSTNPIQSFDVRLYNFNPAEILALEYWLKIKVGEIAVKP